MFLKTSFQGEHDQRNGRVMFSLIYRGKSDMKKAFINTKYLTEVN